MAITAANLTASFSDTDATSYATASVSPGGNRLILLAVASHKTDTASPNAPTASGNGITWVEVVTFLHDAAGADRSRITLLRGMVAAPSAGAVTIDFAGQTQHACLWSVEEFDGVDTSGTDGSGAVVQNGTQDSQGTSALLVTLAAFGSTDNAGYGCFNKQANPSSFTVGSGFTLLGNVASTAPVHRLSSEWKLNDNTVDGTAGSTNQGGGIAIEVKAAAGADTLQDPIGMGVVPFPR